MPTVAGVDGCRGGWLVLIHDPAAAAFHAFIVPGFPDLLKLQPRPALFLVDIPIGLPDAGPRECDRLARALLRRPRSSSVFSPPIRPMLTAATYEQACRIGEQCDGRRLSRQAWNILPKIREVDAAIRSVHPGTTVREVHPEVSFWVWNGGQAMAHNKKTAAGRAERQDLVNQDFSAEYAKALSCLPRREYAHDDLLDAFAALWTAHRVQAGRFLRWPAQPPRDACGLAMELVA